MSFRLARWPGRVVPETDEEITQAVTSLCERAGWRDADLDQVTTVLSGWFAAGWCVDAIVAALDHTPRRERQPPRQSRESVHDYLRTRLRSWFDDDAAGPTERLAPPVPGMSLGRWWHLNQRRRSIEAPRGAAPRLSEAGRQAWEQARRTARSRRRDPLQRVRESNRRIQNALDSLLPPGVAPPPPTDTRRPVRDQQAGQYVADYAARRAAVAADPAVRTVLERLRAQRGRLTPEAVRVARNVISAARCRAELASLEALAATADPATRFSPEAQRILDHLDRAIDEDLPVDAMIALLERPEEDADVPRPGGITGRPGRSRTGRNR